MFMNIGVSLAPVHKTKRERGDFCTSQLPLLPLLISAERLMEFVCAPYLRDGLLDLVLRFVCSRMCGTCLLLSSLLCSSCQGLHVFYFFGVDIKYLWNSCCWQINQGGNLNVMNDWHCWNALFPGNRSSQMHRPTHGCSWEKQTVSHLWFQDLALGHHS